MIEALLPPIQLGLLFAGLMGLGGVGAWRLWIAPAALRHLDEGMAGAGGATAEALAAPASGTEASWAVWAACERRVVRIGFGLALALLPIWALRLHVQLLGFRDPFVPWREDASFIAFETVWGWSWITQGIALVALAAVLGWGLRRSGALARPASVGAGPGRSSLALLLVLLALTNALASHAMAVPFNRWLAVALDAVHLLVAGSWIGSLALILLVTRERHGPLLAAQLRAFSPVAMVSVGILLFSGLQLSAQHVMAWENVFGSPYGRMLSVKVGIALSVFALGGWNWRRGLPLLDSPEGRRKVRVRAGIEIAAAALVVAATAILTGMTMPEGTH